MNVKIPIHERDQALENRIAKMEEWKIAEEDKEDIPKFLKDAGMGKVNRGKKISETRQMKYLSVIKTILEQLGKPVSEITLKDTEALEKWVSNSDYAQSTKSGFFIIFRTYIKWKLGEVKATELTYFFDTKVPKKTPDYLPEADIEKLLKGCRNNEERFLIAVLFDSGARAEEFHNIRREDIQLPSGSNNYVQLTLKEEYSKTNGRVINLYWKHSLNAVRDYLEERREVKQTEPIFNRNYNSTRKLLNRISQRIISRKIHYHLFRHSSATYYASEMNRQQLCYRYGWAFSSDMPDVYISRSGMNNKELDKKFNGAQMEVVQKVNEQLKEDMEKQKREMEELKRMIKEMLFQKKGE
jgi:integrase